LVACDQRPHVENLLGRFYLRQSTGIVIATGDGNYDPANQLFSDSVVVLSRDLKLVDYYTPPNRLWITRKDLDMGAMTPVVFPFKDRELAASGGKEGVIVLLDTKSPGGADNHTPLYRSPLYTNEEVNFSAHGFWGAFSTWEETPGGTRWLLAPAWGPPAADAKFPLQYGETPHGSIMAFKVEDKEGKPVLTPAWNSADMSVPAVIANGVAYALADSDDRKAGTTHATLYALDARTGKVLYSSGDTIKGFVHFGAPIVAGGRAYVVTWDGTLYAFSTGSLANVDK
jgi:outer membrane protein assembly factor BamB